MPERNLTSERIRHGSSYLEIQVAMVLLSMGIGGLYSLSVVQTRQTTRLEQMLPAGEIASINPVSAGSAGESAWAKKLGVYADIDSDAVVAPEMLYPLNRGYVRIVDNEHGWSFWTHEGPGSQPWDSYGGYPGDNQYDVEELPTLNSFGSFAEFTIHGVQPGDYEVLLYCPRQPTFGTAVPHQIYDGGTLVDTVAVDQTVAEDDFQYGGLWWQRLGAYTFHQSSLRVRVLDTPVTGDRIIADAIMLRCRRSLSVVSPVAETADGGVTVTVELN